MKAIKLLLFLGGLTFLGCAEQEADPITRPRDYNPYLGTYKVKTSSKYFDLWNDKITQDSTQLLSFGHVASEYQRYFRETGQIQFLKKAEQALKKAVTIAAIGKADYNRALARNYIAQHRFGEALTLAQTARSYGSGVKESQQLLFDVQMELGDYKSAEKYLDSLKDFSDFGYLIRLAKWNDHLGKLDVTIDFMEKATARAEEAKNRDLMIWSYTNLADYYGHAGRIRDSYQYYLKSLALDPANAYAKKGIAWIVFSHEKNPSEAMRILDSVTRNYQAPDYYLLKAEIAEYMQDHQARMSYLDQYVKMVRNPAYGSMYNAHNVGFYLEETEQVDKAMALAKTEVANRPTPEAYSLLAYSHFKSGAVDTARDIVERHILGKTFEPAVLLPAAEIYKASGKREEAKALKSELAEALYELGPVMEERVNKL